LTDHKLHSRQNKKVEFTKETLSRISEILLHYPSDKKKSALLPVLHIAQQELGGYLSVDTMDYVASLLDIQSIEVYEVATFYTMFNLEPVGKYLIEVCRTGPCSICGGEYILDHLEQTLGIKDGETTLDNLFTLKTVECLGACGTAPVIQVNTEFYESMSIEKIDQLISKLRNNGTNQPMEARWADLF
jgi:NADH-quinone oxidoreductase subunit E